MTWRDDEFDELAAELRRRVGAEFTEEASELEQLSALQRRRRWALVDVAREAMHRGDKVTLAWGARTWVGELKAVGDDYVVLADNDTLIEARVAAISLRVAPSRSGGQRGSPASPTWRARLTELQMNGERALIGFESREVAGAILVVGADFVEIEAEGEQWVVPLDSIAVVLLPRPT